MPGGPGTLHVVSTPIGNLGDLTYRAVEVLRSVDVILAEDTRHARVLLEHYEIRTRSLAFHEHNEAKATPRVIERLRNGESVALISDAGTPLVSDPGARLVRAAVDAGIPVTALPGASAVLAALVVSGGGISTDRFTFYGFLPRTGHARHTVIDEIVGLRHAAVLYEAPTRVGRTLAELAAKGAGTRQVAVARELTKRFEDVRRGTVADLAAYYGAGETESTPRGEVVMVIEGGIVASPNEEEIRERVRSLRAGGATPREIVSHLVDGRLAPRNLAYRLAHEAEVTHEESVPNE